MWAFRWFKRFWNEHGDRLVFMGLAAGMALAFWVWFPDMKAEAKTILVGVAMLLFNKSRSVKEAPEDEESNPTYTIKP